MKLVGNDPFRDFGSSADFRVAILAIFKVAIIVKIILGINLIKLKLLEMNPLWTMTISNFQGCHSGHIRVVILFKTL